MVTLGINEGINSSVVVCRDGQITFALQEERVSREKEYMGFPTQALKFTLEHQKLTPEKIDKVCLSNLESPGFTKEEFLAAYEAAADAPLEEKAVRGWKAALDKVKHTRLTPERKKTAVVERSPYNQKVESLLEEHGFSPEQLVRGHHHRNHAAAAYFGLRKNEQEPHLVLSLDGGGDEACAQVYRCQEGRMELLHTTPVGHSLGNIYSRVTHFMGMRPHEHEYKLMGLAAYAKPDYCQRYVDIFDSYLDLDPEQPLGFLCKAAGGTTRISPYLARDFIRVRFDNLAGGLQFYTENLLLKWVQAAVRSTGIHKVLGSGGVFMNVKANQRIAALPEVEYFDVFPSCGDETLPFGAVWDQYAGSTEGGGREICFESMCLGPDPEYDWDQALARFGNRIVVRDLEDAESDTARMLAEGKVVARCSGGMEFGARALGNRSILADPANSEVVPIINKMIKKRDFWMPFAPAMLLEDAAEFIDIPASLPQRLSPFMMHTFETTERRPDFIAGVHAYDETTRAQCVSPQSNPGFHKLIGAFKKLTGKGVVLNTSFNLHGYPIVMGSCDAIDVLLRSGLTHLVINDRLITKKGD